MVSTVISGTYTIMDLQMSMLYFVLSSSCLARVWTTSAACLPLTGLWVNAVQEVSRREADSMIWAHVSAPSCTLMYPVCPVTDAHCSSFKKIFFLLWLTSYKFILLREKIPEIYWISRPAGGLFGRPTPTRGPLRAHGPPCCTVMKNIASLVQKMYTETFRAWSYFLSDTVEGVNLFAVNFLWRW